MDASQPYKSGRAAESVAAPDELLMERVQHDDREAFGSLMRRYERPVYNFVRRLSGSASDAEDLVQETFLRIYRHRARYRIGSPFRPWLYRIATNLCRDHLRYLAHRRHASLDAPVTTSERMLGDLVRDPAPGPAAHAEASELAARLEHAVQALPVKHRAVFLMARFENMPYEEIARALRIPVGTVKSRMNKAVSQLMNALDRNAP